jgi:hypothetical protein
MRIGQEQGDISPQAWKQSRPWEASLAYFGFLLIGRAEFLFGMRENFLKSRVMCCVYGVAESLMSRSGHVWQKNLD